MIVIYFSGFCYANQYNIIVKEFQVDEGGNLTLPCIEGTHNEEKEESAEDVVVMPPRDRVYWIHEGRAIDSSVLENNSLFLQQIKREDAGIYKCASSDDDEVLNQIKVIVRSKYNQFEVIVSNII